MITCVKVIRKLFTAWNKTYVYEDTSKYMRETYIVKYGLCYYMMI